MQDDDRPSIPRALRRELNEPSEGRNPLPPLALALVAASMIFGAGYFLLYTGDGRVKGGDMRSEVTWQVPAAAGQVDGKQVFANSCASCHQSNGQGVPTTFPPLAGSPWATESEEIPIMIVLKGLQGDIEVKGQTYNGQMMAWEALLNDAQIAAVLTHVRSSWGNQASAIKAEKVAEVRKRFAARKRPWQGGAELRQVAGGK